MRSRFVTKTGVIAATVGSAVGLGNIWRFPYEAGEHGGGAFLLLYMACVVLIGIPVMVAEFSLGASGHNNARATLRQLKARGPFRLIPYIGILSSLMILSFYSVVAGWILEYLYQSALSLAGAATADNYSEIFATFVQNPWRPVLWTVIFLGINFVVLRRGIERGIEKISNILMPFLFLILLVFCVNSMFMSGASRGLGFLFAPDFSQITPRVVIGAMGQAFFSLSLGLTCLLTYASYFSDGTPLLKSAVITAILDMLVAVMAGVMIFPAVFSYGMEPQAGPKLVFEILPSIFSQMAGGRIWAVAFFLLLFFASVTSTISMSEISISYFTDELGMSRQKAAGLNTAIALVFGSLCALSFGVMSEMKIFGMTLFDFFDYTSSNILLPTGGILISIFVGWWLDRAFLGRMLAARRVVAPLRFCIRYVAPAAILTIFIYGLL